MNSLWDRLDALVGRAVTSTFGTSCEIAPRLSNDYTVGPDPAREAATVRGVFSLEPDISDLRGQRIQGEFPGTTLAVVSDAQVQIVAAEAAKIGYLPIKGDQMVFPDVPAHQTYAVSVTHVLDSGDLLVLLTREKT